MADLSHGDRDRGQLLLVAALAIAVAIVALVVLLNTSIYMENLATRDTDTGASEAIAFRNTVEENLWRVVAAENDRTYASRSTLEGNVSNRTDRFVALTAGRYRRSGAVAELSNTTFHDGTRLRQTDPTREFTSASGAANWTLATSADGVREFEVNVTGGLTTTATPQSDAFGVNVDGSGGNRWSLYAYNDGGGERIAVKNGTGPVNTNVCSGLYTQDPRVNLTAGTVNGTACPAIDFARGTSAPYDVSYQYGNRSTGTYRLTVNTSNVGNVNGPGPTTSPYRVPVVYSVTTDVVYRSPTLAYRANVTVQKGGA
ncbi:MAG: hypothetical protein ABEJ43_01275 [Haloferacaceae archaeon]